MTGFENAKGHIIIFLCADLQSDPEEDIPKLLEKINEGYDMVVGWRQGRKEFKRFASWIYYFLSRMFFGVKVHDPNWIKAFRKEVVEGLNLRSSWHRYIVSIATQEGYKVAEVKTNWYPRKSGKSKYGFSRLIPAVMDLIVLKFEMTFLEKPLQFFGSIGLLLFIAGFIVDGCLVFFLDIFASGTKLVQEMPKLLFGILLMITGLQLFSIGLLGEMLVSLIKRKEK
jgi:glycosyltransferase involved in cell wall biosynthesis